MTTVTGKILDANDNPLHVLVSFNPQSTPFINSGGQVIASNSIFKKSNPNDGTYSVDLEPGTYAVTYSTSPQIGFTIVVPASGGPYTIDQLTSIPAPATSYAPAGSGSPEGVIPATPGLPYTDVTNGAFYIKFTGTGNTGWQLIVQL